jgi:hypothetical protein
MDQYFCGADSDHQEGGFELIDVCYSCKASAKKLIKMSF